MTTTSTEQDGPTFSQLYNTIWVSAPKVVNNYDEVIRGVFKKLTGFETRNRAGEVFKGLRCDLPEFVRSENGVWTVSNHTQVLRDWADPSGEGSDTVWGHYPELPLSEGRWVNVPEPKGLLHGTVKRNLPLGTWMSGFLQYVGYTGDELSVVTEAATAGLMRQLMPIDMSVVTVEFLQGDDIPNWYRDHHTTSYSCMTGERYKCTETWATNPLSCRLAVISHGDDEVARTLVMQPQGEGLPSSVEPDATGNWKFIRMYPIAPGRRSCDDTYPVIDRCLDIGIRALTDRGIWEFSRLTTGFVPLTVTDYSPYIDHIMMYRKEEGIRCVGQAGLDLVKFEDGWRQVGSRTDGAGYGNNIEDELHEDEDDNSYCCDCCEGSTDYEDCYPIDGGDSRICVTCYDSGDYVGLESGGHTHMDNASNFRSLACPDTAIYVDNAAENRRYRDFSSGERILMPLTHVAHSDGTALAVPTSEVVHLIDGTMYWVGDDGHDTVHITMSLHNQCGMLVLESHAPGLVLSDACTRVMIDGVATFVLNKVSDNLTHMVFLDSKQCEANGTLFSIEKYADYGIVMTNGGCVCRVIIRQYNGDGTRCYPEMNTEYSDGLASVPFTAIPAMLENATA